MPSCSVSSASSASTAPYTPYASHTVHSPQSDGFGESSPLDDVATPPSGSIRAYSCAITASMRRHLDEMKDKQVSRAEMVCDPDARYWEEDPIDRHVRLNFPSGERRPSLGRHSASSLLLDAMDIVGDIDVDMSAPTPARSDSVDTDADAGPPPFRPGLLHFHRSRRSSSFSAGGTGRSIPPFAHSESSTSTSTSTSALSSRVDSAVSMRDVDTPGSMWSDASFEAMRVDDWISLYGEVPKAARLAAAKGDGSAYRDSQASMASDATVRVDYHVGVGVGVGPGDAAFAQPVRPGLAVRQRQHSRTHQHQHPYAMPAQFADAAEEDWLQGRTISETMVAQAGLRCQRGRAARGSALH